MYTVPSRLAPWSGTALARFDEVLTINFGVTTGGVTAVTTIDFVDTALQLPAASRTRTRT